MYLKLKYGVADNSQSSVTLYIANPINYLEFDDSEFIVAPVMACVITRY